MGVTLLSTRFGEMFSLLSGLALPQKIVVVSDCSV